MKKVAVFTYLQRHLKKLLPLLPVLNENFSTHLILMTREEQALAEAAGLKYRMLDEFADQPRDSDFDLSWGLAPLLRALEDIRPDLFIAIEVNYILRNAVGYCKRRGIRTLIIQHGTPNPCSLHAFVPFEGDCFAAWGEYSRTMLQPYFAHPEKIRLTGGVNFDRTLKLSGDKPALSRELDLDPGKKWILFTTQTQGAGGLPTAEEIRQSSRELAGLAARHPECQLLYQVHPSQTLEEIAESICDVPGHNARVLRYHDTEKLIAASDGLITFFSTTAIDAVLLNKPLMLINLAGDRDFLPFVQEGAAWGAYAVGEIEPAFLKLLSLSDDLQPQQRRMALHFNYQNDGKALERILMLCRQLMGSPARGDHET